MCRLLLGFNSSMMGSSRASRGLHRSGCHLPPLKSTQARRGHSLGRSLPVRTWPESELGLLSRFKEKNVQGKHLGGESRTGEPPPKPGRPDPRIHPVQRETRSRNSETGTVCRCTHLDKPPHFPGAACSSAKGTHSPCLTSQGCCKDPARSVCAESEERRDAERHRALSALGVRLAMLVSQS